MLSDLEVSLLRTVQKRIREIGYARSKLPPHPRIQSLVKRGYLRQVRMISGETYEEDPGFVVTEAGRIVLESLRSKNTDTAQTPQN